ncbi:efflux RND transporter periplasmic adaptor subunit [Mariprofundus ferrooxydans]|uniref:efflux RND transporter periplasmic adaptor subunit n=1 Tax=Mariprofundus ferrooxydans TaxID=314344 RepID=UPI00142FA14D|nr:efflux RND transporter periplasmic adaptor subunit [Mariprofundus ferrooxydans]
MKVNNIGWMIVILIAGVAAGYYISAAQHGIGQHAAAAKTAESGPCAGGAQAVMWRNPMNPSVISPVPAKDGMGMDYIPVCADKAGDNGPAGTVTIDPTVTQNIGVRITQAVERNLSREITTVGRVTFDETRLMTLHPKVAGWVDKLFVDKTGESVKQNTMLLSFYAPELVATQEEYLLALANWEQLKASQYKDIREGAKRLLDSSLDRLRFFDVPEHQIRALQRTHKVLKNMHIHAPAAGIVTRIGIREGAHVTPDSELYQIADLSRVWVLADLYEYEIGWVKRGDHASLRVASLPGERFSGKITYIYPYLDPKTRTNKVRIEFDNSSGLLKPDMFGDVTIASTTTRPGIYVPKEAVLITGKSAHLFVRSKPGHFEPRTVKTGISADGQIEIVEGVKAGEMVVSSGQFLIDSESSIREAAAKMVSPGSASKRTQVEKAGQGMSGMNMKMDRE